MWHCQPIPSLFACNYSIYDQRIYHGIRCSSYIEHAIKSTLTALIAGLLFGSGLVISGMTNPANILSFLDLAGDWHPALALVMLSAIIVAMPAFTWVRRNQRNLVGESVVLDNKRPIDKRLIIGAVIFGVGWGLSGLCPAPSLIAGFGGNANILVFVVTMTIGLWLSSSRFFKH